MKILILLIPIFLTGCVGVGSWYNASGVNLTTGDAVVVMASEAKFSQGHIFINCGVGSPIAVGFRHRDGIFRSSSNTLLVAHGDERVEFKGEITDDEIYFSDRESVGFFIDKFRSPEHFEIYPLSKDGDQMSAMGISSYDGWWRKENRFSVQFPKACGTHPDFSFYSKQDSAS